MIRIMLLIAALLAVDVMAAPPQGAQGSNSQIERQEWGPAVRGLQASVSLATTVPTQGEPITVQYRIRNISGEPIKIVDAGFWPNHRIDVTTVDGMLVSRTTAGKDALRVFLSGDRRKTVLRTLMPAEVLDDAQTITHFELRSGVRYRLSITYVEGSVELKSNQVEFTVR